MRWFNLRPPRTMPLVIVLSAGLCLGVTAGVLGMPAPPRIGHPLAAQVRASMAKDLPLASPVHQVSVTTDRDVLTAFTDTATISAAVRDGAGHPLAGVPVTFHLDTDEAGQLTSGQVLTDANGVATTVFVPEFYRGTVTITGIAGEAFQGHVTLNLACGSC